MLIHKILKKTALYAATAAALALPLFAAHAEAALETTFVADESNPLGTAIAEELTKQQEEQAGGSYVTGVQAVSSSGTVILSLSAEEAGTVAVRLYNDYGETGNKLLLASSQPVAVEAQQQSVTVTLSGASVPQYYVLEADYVSASGITNTFCYYDRTEDIQFVRNATAEDFREGYYVPVQSGTSEKSEKALMGAGDGSGSAEESTGSYEGYVAYNEDLIILPGDTAYTVRGKEGEQTVIFEEIPEALANLTEEELSEVKGFVLRGETIEDDVFLLSDGLSVDGGKATMAVREAEDLSDLYRAVHLSSVSFGANEKPLTIKSDYATGTFTYTCPPVKVEFDAGFVYVKTSFSMVIRGVFDLTLKKTFSGDNYKCGMTPPSGGKKQIKLNIPKMGINLAGVYVFSDASLYVAANNPVHITGKYGGEYTVSISVGSSTGLSKHSTNPVPEIIDFVPVTPNVNTYAYICKEGTWGFEYPKIGSFSGVVKVSEDLKFECSASGILEKDQTESTGEFLHACSSVGKKGCISGVKNGSASVALTVRIGLKDLLNKTFTPFKYTVPTETEYFYRSLEYGDGKESLYPVSCPHLLRAYTVRTMENANTISARPLVNSVLSGDMDTGRSTLRTDAYGEARIYLPLRDEPCTVSAVDSDGAAIASATVTVKTAEDEPIAPTILLNRDTRILTIDQIDIEGKFPAAVGDIVLQGSAIRSVEGDVTYLANVLHARDGDYIKSSYDLTYKVNWGFKIGGTKKATAGLMHVTFTTDFADYRKSEGLPGARLDPNVAVTIMGSTGGNPATSEGHRFIITDVTVSNGVDAAGVLQPDTVLTVKAVFYIPDEDNQFSIVTVNNGLKAVSSRFYRVGTEALVIGKDTADTVSGTIARIQAFESETWPESEKKALIKEILSSSGSEKPFYRWTIEKGKIDYPKDFTPLITSDGILTYNTATIPVGKENITVKANYEGKTTQEIDKVYLTINEPVPGEYLSSAKYATGTASTDPGGCHVVGIAGEPKRTVNLDWELDNAANRGVIRFNTTYFVRANVVPESTAWYEEFEEELDYWRFKYPLGTEEGTKAYIRPNGGEAVEAFDFYLDGTSAQILHTFTTRKAKLLAVIDPDDLYFPVGTQQEVINRVLAMLEVGVLSEDDSVTSTEVNWNTVTNAEIPGAGGSFTVPGKAVLPDSLDCDDMSLLNTKVVIHIYGADMIDPPKADPKPGVYRCDLSVELFTEEGADKVLYYVTKDGIETEPAFEEYTEPVKLIRALDKTVTWQIHAKAVRGDLVSETVTFTYVLLPANTIFQLTVYGGEASSEYACGSIIWLPAAKEVMLVPITPEGYVFDHWEVEKQPEYFTWIKDTDEKTANARFNMPAQDLVINAYFVPEADGRFVTKLYLTVEPPLVGDTKLAEKDIIAQFDIDEYTASKKTGSVNSSIEACSTLNWEEEVSEENPVNYGEDYTFSEVFDIENLTNRTAEEGFTGEKFQLTDLFSPSITAYINGEPADSVYLSYDLKTLLVEKTFTFGVDTYTVRYDANGGTLGEVPEQVVQLAGIPTKLTDKKPTLPEGGAFLGWSVSPEAEEPEYVYTKENTPEFKEDITLYAVWPFNVEVRWLDHDNSENTRAPFKLAISTGTEKTVDPKDAKEKDGVGIQQVKFAYKQDYAKSAVTVDGVGSGLVTLSNGSVYEVSVENGSAKCIVTLTAKRVHEVEKEWDIDFEKNDKPASVTAILQTTEKPEEKGIVDELIDYVKDGNGEDYEKVIAAVEKETGYSLRNLSPEDAAGTLTHLVSTGEFTAANVKEGLTGMLKADTDDSDGWYACQKVQLSAENSWQYKFEPVDRFIGKVTKKADGTISAEWKSTPKYRVVEKAGKAPVEDGKDATFTVPAYQNIAGKQVDEHKTVYQVTYKTDGDKTTITNLAVEDHYLIKEWLLVGDAKKPENVYIALLWKYDEDYLEAAKDLIPGDLTSLWLPEINPISGTKISVGDILRSFHIYVPFADMIELPICIAKVNEGNNWRASYRIKKYGEFGIPQVHEGAEFFGAICQNAIQYFLKIHIPIGINPLQGFITVSVPEFTMPFTADKIDLIVNIKAKFDDEEHINHRLGGSKYWDDDLDADGIRPDSITLHIIEDGSKKVADITVKRSDNLVLDKMGVWGWSYEDDAIDTSKHTYTVTEDAVEGYKTEISGFSVKNIHRPESKDYVKVHVAKFWDDGSGAKQQPLTVMVTQNGADYKEVTLNADNGWETVLLKCPKVGSDGKAIQYAVVEKSVPAGYTESYRCIYSTDSSTWNCYVTNKKPTGEKVLLEGNKYWDDDGTGRPGSVLIHLFADGKPVDSFVLSKDNNWHWSGQYDKYNSEGKKIAYTVKEDPLSSFGYHPKISGLNITNSRKMETVDVEIRKTWYGTNATHPKQPVTVQLYMNGIAYGDPVTLNESNDWNVTFTKLARYDSDGNAYVFSIVEDPVPAGFYAFYYVDETGGRIQCRVRNQAEHEKADPVDVRIIKVWDDTAVATSHSDIKLTLLQNGTEYRTVTVSGNENWTYLFRDMPKTDAAGKAITYSVVEKSVPDGYTVSYQSSYNALTRTWTLTAINKADPQTVILRGTKTWVDNNNAAGERPASVTVRLLADGAQVAVYTLNESNNWSWSGVFVKKNAAGRNIVYTLTEDEVPGYTSKVEGLNVTNTYKTKLDPEKIAVRVVKKWVGTSEEYPAVSVAVQLKRNGVNFKTPFILSEKNNWTMEFTGITRQALNVYTAEETTELPGFYVSYDTSVSANGSLITLTITNTHVDRSSNVIKGTKTWVDNKDALKKRPDSVLYYILANGTKVVDQKTLSKASGWKWSGMYPATDASGAITYSIIEAPVPNYTTSYSADKLSATNTLTGSNLTITNTVTYGDTGHKFPFHIQLADNEGKPFSGTLTAELNGKPALASFTLGDSQVILGHGDTYVLFGIPDGWEYLVEELENDGFATWVIDKENRIPERSLYADTREARDIYPSYTSVAKKNLQDSTANFYNEQLIDIPVTKVWDDKGASTRPSSITINLLANGKIVDSQEVIPTGTGDWSCVFEDKHAISQGKKINYTITEDPVKDYKSSVSGFTVTNTYSPTRYSFTFYKVWHDYEDDHGAPDFILYYSDGTICRNVDEPPKRVKGTDGNPDKFTYSSLVRNDVYYVREVPMDGYETHYSNVIHPEVDDRAYNGGRVVNTVPNYVPRTGDNEHPWLVAALALTSLTGAAVFLKKRRSAIRGKR